MAAIASEMNVARSTISKTIKEDLGMKSYTLKKRQLLTEAMKERRCTKAHALLSELKHGSAGLLRFFSDEKNFIQDQLFNRQNDRFITNNPDEVPIVISTKFSASVMVLGVVLSEGDVMPPHFFDEGLRIAAKDYIQVLETIVKPWMDQVANGREYVFQQDSAPAHKARITQAWCYQNLPHQWSPDLWPPSSPDCNPLDYFVWGVLERIVNSRAYNTKQELREAIHTAMTTMDKKELAKACAAFRRRLEAVVAAEGAHIE